MVDKKLTYAALERLLKQRTDEFNALGKDNANLRGKYALTLNDLSKAGQRIEALQAALDAVSHALAAARRSDEIPF